MQRLVFADGLVGEAINLGQVEDAGAQPPEHRPAALSTEVEGEKLIHQDGARAYDGTGPRPNRLPATAAILHDRTAGADVRGPLWRPGPDKLAAAESAAFHIMQRRPVGPGGIAGSGRRGCMLGRRRGAADRAESLQGRGSTLENRSHQQRISRQEHGASFSSARRHNRMVQKSQVQEAIDGGQGRAAAGAVVGAALVHAAGPPPPAASRRPLRVRRASRRHQRALVLVDDQRRQRPGHAGRRGPQLRPARRTASASC